MLKVAIIIGSTRPGRVGEAVARWVYELARKRREFELVDIKDFNLPLLDEPVPPSQGKYSKAHTKKWAATIASFDGYAFVTPEYNHGICAALKNAIDRSVQISRFQRLSRGRRGGRPAWHRHQARRPARVSPRSTSFRPDLRALWAEHVDDIMRRHVVTLAPRDPARTAVDCMLASRLHSVPVVEYRGRREVLVGIVSRSDVLECFIIQNDELA